MQVSPKQTQRERELPTAALMNHINNYYSSTLLHSELKIEVCPVCLFTSSYSPYFLIEMPINDQITSLCVCISQVRRVVLLNVYPSNGFPLLSAGFSLTMCELVLTSTVRELSRFLESYPKFGTIVL